MRVFIAVDLPPELRKELAKLQRELDHLTDTARWVASESVHITLKFIGEVAETRLEDIDAALTDLTWKPFAITVRGVGLFPGRGTLLRFSALLLFRSLPVAPGRLFSGRFGSFPARGFSVIGFPLGRAVG